MTEKTRKIIAREFLIFIVALIIGFLIIFGTLCYNFILQIKEKNIQQTINEKGKLADSLAKSYNIKTFKDKDYISRVYSALNDIGENSNNFKSEDTFRKIILNDSVYQKSVYHLLQNKIEGFTKSFMEFTNSLKIQLTQDDINKKVQSRAIETEINKLTQKGINLQNSYLNTKEKIKISLYIFLLTILFLFPLRYLVYATNWSIKTLKK